MIRRAASKASKAVRFSSTVIPPSRLGRSASVPTTYRSPSINPWKPFAPIAEEILGSRFMDEFDRDFVSKFFGSQQQNFDEVPLDIKESPSGFDLQVDLPGVKKEDIHVDLKDRVLSISAERKGMTKETGETFRRVERYRGHMSRSIVLPDDLNVDAIEADYSDGVLHVKMPKIPESERPSGRVITIN